LAASASGKTAAMRGYYRRLGEGSTFFSKRDIEISMGLGRIGGCLGRGSCTVQIPTETRHLKTKYKWEKTIKGRVFNVFINNGFGNSDTKKLK
jgi:hypothetical protein